MTACGGDSKKVDPAADLATAKAAVLTAADLPGYAATPSTSSDDMPKSAKQEFAKCLHVKTSFFDTTPGAQNADSPDFDKDQSTVSASVELDPSRADITQGWNDLNKSEFARCFGQLFDSALRTSAPPRATFGTADVTRFSPQIGNHAIGYQVTIPVTTSGRDLTFYFDFLGVTRDRAGITLTALNVDQPFDRATEIALARKMYDRVGNRAA
jgi:hypothetical protein